MEFSIDNNSILIFCVLFALATVLYYILKAFIQERNIAKSEIAAELDTLSNKLFTQQQTEEHRL